MVARQPRLGNTRGNKRPGGRRGRPLTASPRLCGCCENRVRSEQRYSSFCLTAKVPCGNAPAFGRFAAAFSPPALGVTSSPSVPHPGGSGNSSAPSAASSFNSNGTSSGFGTFGLSGFGSSAAAPLTVPGTPNAATGTSSSSSVSPWIALTVAASGQNKISSPPAVSSCVIPNRLYTPRSELTAEELQQFEAKRFTMGKIPLKPPPTDLVFLPDSFFF